MEEIYNKTFKQACVFTFIKHRGGASCEAWHSLSNLLRTEKEINDVEQVKVLQIGVVNKLATAIRHGIVACGRAVKF